MIANLPTICAVVNCQYFYYMMKAEGEARALAGTLQAQWHLIVKHLWCQDDD